MESEFEGFINIPTLRRLAGDEVFAQGESCLTAGHVRQVHAGPDRITARIDEGRPYRVKLWKSRGELQHACTCPAGMERRFCLHCVAVGLAWLSAPAANEESATAEATPAKAARSAEIKAAREKLESHLRSLTRDRLVELVLEATEYDDILRRRMLLEAAGVARAATMKRATKTAAAPDFDAYRRLLREAIATSDYVDYEALPDYVQGVREAIAPLRGMLREGHAALVAELVEFALVELDRVNDLLDGSDGSLNPVYDDLQTYHHRACRAAKPDPAQLAARLLEYEIEGGLGVFNNAAKAYAEVLGEVGLDAWRAKLTEAWMKMGDGAGGGIDYRRFQVQTLMERLAEADGDIELLIEIKRRDLHTAHDSLSLAELYAAHGRDDDAIAIAKAGLERFDISANGAGLRDLLVSIYERTGKTTLVTEILWEEFRRTVDFADYRQLRAHVRTASESDWPAWRDRAIELFRADGAPDGSALVELLLEEGHHDAAWHEALARGCRVGLWMELAAGRETEHPSDSLSVYQARLEPTIATGGPAAYREAIELLDRIRALLDRLGRAEDFATYREEIRSANRQRRGFVRLLDASDRGN